jgi:NADH:ubiquinone oxidoreductase subunit 6 (subunit J)
VNIVDLLFYFFATLSVGGAVLMIFSKHPVPAALFTRWNELGGCCGFARQ